MNKKVVKDEHVLQVALSAGVDVVLSNLPEPLRLVERAVIAACNDIGIKAEHEINGLSFSGRVMLKIMEMQTGEKLIPEHINDSSQIIFISKVAAYAAKFGADRAAKAYSLTTEQVESIIREAGIHASLSEDFSVPEMH